MAVSQRTCIGCRRADAPATLVRVVLDEGRLFFGARGGRRGRGASIHPNEPCVVKAVQTRAFARAFKAPVGGLDGAKGVGELLQGIKLVHAPQASDAEMRRTS